MTDSPALTTPTDPARERRIIAASAMGEATPLRATIASARPADVSSPVPELESIEIVRLRRAPYRPTWDLQRERATAVAVGAAREALFLVEHPPVYTLGRRTAPEHVLVSEADLAALGAEVVPVDRGGDVTWHGPGQLTGYPILALAPRGRDLHAYVWNVEQLLIDLAATYGIGARRAPGMPGVWVGQEKVAAVGIKIARGWVSYHGFGLNVDPDLRWFEHIVPCGLHGWGVTSLARLLGHPVSLEEVEARLVPLFQDRFAPGLRLITEPDATLPAAPAVSAEPDAIQVAAPTVSAEPA